MSDSTYPAVTRELVEARRAPAPQTEDAFRGFSRKVFPDGALPAKTRYRAADAPCRFAEEPDGGFTLESPEPQWAVTPGQSAVLYRGEECLGGGVIA